MTESEIAKQARILQDLIDPVLGRIDDTGHAYKMACILGKDNRHALRDELKKHCLELGPVMYFIKSQHQKLGELIEAFDKEDAQEQGKIKKGKQ